MPRCHAAILPTLALTTTSHPMTAKRTAPSLVGRGFNRDTTPERKNQGLQPLKYAANRAKPLFAATLPRLQRHSLSFSLQPFVPTRHSSLSSTHPVNFYCGHYGSSPRKSKGTANQTDAEKKGVSARRRWVT